MNVKSVEHWISDYWVWALPAGSALPANLAGVPFLLWLCVSLIWVVLCCVEPLRSRVGPGRRYYQAAKVGQKTRFQECLDLVSKHLRMHPRDDQGYGLKALALFGSGHPEETLAEADQAVAMKRRWQSLMIRGQILGALGCTDEALADLEESWKLKARPFTRMLIGQAYVYLRRLDTAAAILERSTKSVRLSLTYVGLGDCYRFLGEPKRAEAAYAEAIDIVRREVARGHSSSSIAAYCLAQLSREREAIDVAVSALEKNDTDVFALWTQALVDTRRGETGRVEATLNKMLLISSGPVIGALVDPQFTPLLAERRFRELLAWAIGAQRQTRERVLARMR